MKTYTQAVRMIAEELRQDWLNGVFMPRANGDAVRTVAFVFEAPVSKVWDDVEFIHDQLAKGAN